MTTQYTQGQIIDLKDFGKPPAGIVSRWLQEIDLAKKEQKVWQSRCHKVLKLYKNDYGAEDSLRTDSPGAVKYNMLWSSIETTKQAIYARTPKVVCKPKNGRETEVTRLASELLQRATQYFVNNSDVAFNDVMQSCRDDYLLLARGQIWVNYSPTYGEEEIVTLTAGEAIPTGYEKEIDQEGNEFYRINPVIDEDIKVEYINWQDFLHSPARRWNEVRWVAKRAFLTFSDVKKYFGRDIASMLSYGDTKEEVELDEHDIYTNRLYQRAEILEIWNKEDNKVYFISPSCKNRPLKIQQDPLGLKHFFPCPRPLLGTRDNDTLIPVPDYILTQHLLDSMNEITYRVGILTKAIKIFGVFDASFPDIQNIFSQDENYLVPIQNWSSFQEIGGFQGVMQTFPIVDYLQAIERLNIEKEKLKQEFYEISGFSDLMRGVATPNESATSQQMRAKFTNLRLSARQEEMQRFCRDSISLMGEVIAKHFSPELLVAISGITPNSLENPEILNNALMLLQNDMARNFSLEIETDSTLAINAEAEKTDRIDFINMTSNFFNMAISISERLPEFLNPAMQILRFGVDAFRAGQPIQASLDKSITQYIKRRQEEAQSPQPVPIEIQEMQMKAQMEQQRLQMEANAKQAELQKELQDSQMKFQIKQQELQQEYQKMQIEQSLALQKMQTDFQIQMEKIKGELFLLREKASIEGQLTQEKIYTQADATKEKNIMDYQSKISKAQLDFEAKQKKAELDLAAKVMASQQPPASNTAINIKLDKLS